MKKFFQLFFCLFVSSLALAQTPEMVNYQAVIRDAANNPILNQTVSLRFSIHETSSTGTVKYQETHTVQTNDYGLINLQIGTGVVISGSFSTLAWGSNAHFVEMEIDENGGSTFKSLGTSQLISVPYALHAKTAGNVSFNDTSASNEIQQLYISTDTLFLSDGGFVKLPTIKDADADPGNEIQQITIKKDTVFLSGSGYIKLPTDLVDDADANPTNELQTLTMQQDTLYISNGGFVVLPKDQNTTYTAGDGLKLNGNTFEAKDTSPTNEIQSISQNGNFIRLSKNGGSILLDHDGYYKDSSATNELQNLSKTGITIALTNGGSITLIDDDITNEIQALSFANDTLTLSNGGKVFLGNYLDNTDNQQLTIVGDSLFLSNGGKLKLPTDLVFDGDSSATNELQNLSKTGKTISLTNGGSITLIDDDITNEIQVLSFASDTLTLNNGGKVFLGNYLDNTDDQQLTIVGDSLFLSNGGKLKLPTDLVFDGDSSATNELQNLSKTGKMIALTNGGSITLIDDDTTNEIQVLSFVNDTLTLSNGGKVFLGAYLDNTDDQQLTIVGDSLFLSNGGKLKLPTDQVFDGDSSPSNELQTLSKTGKTIALTNGGSITLIDDDTTNEIQAISFSGDTLYLSNGGNVYLGNYLDNTDNQLLSIVGDSIFLGNGGSIELPTDNVFDGDSSSTNEIQTLSKSGNAISLTNGGSITLTDDDTTNELQAINFSGDTLYLSNGGNVYLGNYMDNTDNQLLSIVGDSIFLGNGGSIELPTDNVFDGDSSSTNELQEISKNGDTIRLNKNGGLVILDRKGYYKDSSAVNELQSISKMQQTISIDRGGSVTLNDDDSLNEIQTISRIGDTLYLNNGGGQAVLPFDSSRWLRQNNTVYYNQGNVAIGKSEADSSAILDLSGDTSGGLLLPKLTINQRNAIPNPKSGLMIYNTDQNCPNYYNGLQWMSLCSSFGSICPPCDSSSSGGGSGGGGSSFTPSNSPIDTAYFFNYNNYGGHTNVRFYTKSIKIDPFGNSYIGGSFNYSTYFDSSHYVHPVGYDFFLMKINNTGQIVWVKNSGWSSSEEIYSIAVNDSAEIYAYGGFTGGQNTSLPYNFVRKYDSNGNLKWHKEVSYYRNSTSFKYYNMQAELETDNAGNIYLRTKNESVMDNVDSIKIGGKLFFPNQSRNYSTLLVKADKDFNTIWGNFIEANSVEFTNGMIISNDGDIYLSGRFNDTLFYNNNKFQLGGSSQYKSYLMKLHSNGSLNWYKSLGHTGAFDFAIPIGALGLDKSNNVYVAGQYKGYLYVNSSFLYNPSSQNAGFIVKLDSVGNTKYLIDLKYNLNNAGIGVDSSGNAYLAGTVTEPMLVFGGISTANCPNSYGAPRNYSSRSYFIRLSNTGSIDDAILNCTGSTSSNSSIFSLHLDKNDNINMIGYSRNRKIDLGAKSYDGTYPYNGYWHYWKYKP